MSVRFVRWRAGLALVALLAVGGCAGPFSEGAMHEATLRRDPSCAIWFVRVDGARYETRQRPPTGPSAGTWPGRLDIGRDGAATFVADGFELPMWGGPDAAFAADCPFPEP